MQRFVLFDFWFFPALLCPENRRHSTDGGSPGGLCAARQSHSEERGKPQRPGWKTLYSTALCCHGGIFWGVSRHVYIFCASYKITVKTSFYRKDFYIEVMTLCCASLWCFVPSRWFRRSLHTQQIRPWSTLRTAQPYTMLLQPAMLTAASSWHREVESNSWTTSIFPWNLFCNLLPSICVPGSSHLNHYPERLHFSSCGVTWNILNIQP